MYFKMWGKEFVEALQNNNWEQVISIKNESVHEKIYKYIPLFDDKWSNYLQENKKRLNSLEDEKIWVSSPKTLNDPFELNALSPDKKRVEKSGWDIVLIQSVLNLLKSNIQVCCFSDKYSKRIPLWSHYANNHQGYCVEYLIINKDQIFPIRYSNRRLISATIVTRLCSAFLELYKEKDSINLDFWHYYHMLFLTFFTKSSEWKYEHEFRYVDQSDQTDLPGKLVPLQTAGLRIKKIFIGLRCNPDYEIELRRIGKKLNVPLYKMKIVDSSRHFYLKSFLSSN